MNTLKPWQYPSLEPFKSGYLDVGDGHRMYFEECGNPQGIPLVFLHGGPGAPSDAVDRQKFNPEVFRMILFHQRGAGNSTPQGSVRCNTTAHLVEDMEKLRVHLGVQRWVMFGRSWGSTLALAYAQAYPQAVRALVLGGVFLGTQAEIDWTASWQGAGMLFPDKFAGFEAFIPPSERSNLIAAYLKRLQGDAASARAAAAQVLAWEGYILKMETTVLADMAEQAEKAAAGQDDAEEEFPDFLVHFCRVMYHYMANGCFLAPNQLLQNADKLKDMPLTIIQGRYDVLCPVNAAWQLHKALPHSTLVICPNAGHSGSEEQIAQAMFNALNRLEHTLSQQQESAA